MAGKHEGDEEGRELTDQELEEQLKAFQVSQQVYLQQNFKWLIEFVNSYFPEDELILRDLDLEVHFVHRVIEGGKPLGALVYRFRKFVDKKEYFKEMAEDYREGLEVPDVFFVDSETSKFEEPKALESDDNYIEIPPDKLAGKIRDLREELKKRAKMRQLRESV